MINVTLVNEQSFCNCSLCTPYGEFTKDVTAYGITFKVPEKTTHVTLDSDGTITAFMVEPSIWEGEDYWAIALRGEIGYVNIFTEDDVIINSGNWRESLIAV